MSYGLYAAPGASTDLATDRLVGWATDLDLPADRWLRRLTRRSPDIRTSQLEAQHAAIRAGIGIGILPCFLAVGLQRIDTEAQMNETLWLVGHAQSSTKRVELLRKEIISIIEATKDRLAP